MTRLVGWWLRLVRWAEWWQDCRCSLCRAPGEGAWAVKRGAGYMAHRVCVPCGHALVSAAFTVQREGAQP